MATDFGFEKTTAKRVIDNTRRGERTGPNTDQPPQGPIGQLPKGFWAKITDNASGLDSNPNRWTYSWVEQYKSDNGWIDGELSGDKDDPETYAANSVENDFDPAASQYEPVGTDIAPALPVVWMHWDYVKVDDEVKVRYAFQYEEPTVGTPPSSVDSVDSTPGSSSSQSSQSSAKTTAIVPATWSKTGYAALFIAECPEVRFDDVATLTLPRKNCSIAIDPKFLEVCEPNSVQVCGCITDQPVTIGACVKNGKIVVRFGRQSPKKAVRAVIRLTGIRKGFAGHRFPNRTRNQFEANEKFINSAYPGK